MSAERHLFTEITPWTGEHIHRYKESAKYISEGDVVLDIACGSGYGADILSRTENTTIYAGDIDNDSVNACKKEWDFNKRLHFEVMDATCLRFGNAFFDVIISLETIEHLTGYREMVAEFGRIVKPGGVIIISTPNIKISSPDGKIVNPFHVHEFTYEELADLLKTEFSEVKIYGQKYTRYNTAGHLTGKQGAEMLLLARGIRKIPYKTRNRVFRRIFGSSLYPTPDDYQMFSGREFIEKNCHVLFAVCRK